MQKEKESAKALDVFVNPVYAVVRLKLDAKGRSFDEVIYAKTRDAADCQSYSKSLSSRMTGFEGGIMGRGGFEGLQGAADSGEE